MTRTDIERRWISPLGLTLLAVAACGSSQDPEGGAGRGLVTSSVVFGDNSESTYVSLLESLVAQQIDYRLSREFPGWADIWVNDGKLFVADAEAPLVSRFSLDGAGRWVEEGRLSFANHGAESASFWTNLFVSPTKAYLFVVAQRTVVTWNPQTLEITGTFPLPAIADRGALTLQVPSTDRSSIVRGNRAYVPTTWANWKDLALSDDSILLVIDTAADRVIDTVPIPCPNINVGTQDDQQNIYLSNWVFSVAPTLLQGQAPACAVRIKAGADTLDPEWSLTFKEVTGGREAAALRYLGGGQALMSVFYPEQAAAGPDVNPYAFVEGPHWRFWTLDLSTREAKPLDGLGWHSGGYYSTRLGGQNMLFVPSADYATTAVYELSPDGRASPRWDARGWATRLFSGLR